MIETILNKLKKEFPWMSIDNSDGHVLIGTADKTYWIELLDESPLVEGHKMIKPIPKYDDIRRHLETNKGAFYVCWNIEQIYQLLTNNKGDYITPKKYQEEFSASYE